MYQRLPFCMKASKRMLYRLWNTFWQPEIAFFLRIEIFIFFTKIRFHEKFEFAVLPHQKSSIRHAAGWITNFKHISGAHRTHFSTLTSNFNEFWSKDFQKNEYVGLPLYWLCRMFAIYSFRRGSALRVTPKTRQHPKYSFERRYSPTALRVTSILWQVRKLLYRRGSALRVMLSGQ